MEENEKKLQSGGRMIETLLAMHIVLSGAILLSSDIIRSVILMAVFSLFSSLLFFVLHAPDVALTEAAVGAGISTFLYIWIIRKTGRGRDH